MKLYFLGREAPCVMLTAHWLLEKGGDLSQTLVVVASARARQELMVALLRLAEEREWILEMPAIVTMGQFPERLYRQTKPLADTLTQKLAWSRAVQESDPKWRESVISQIPEKENWRGNLALGEMFVKLHTELAAEALSFTDVVEKLQEMEHETEFAERQALLIERQRWEYFAEVQQKYHQILDGLGIWDQQSARLFALEHPQPEKEGLAGDFQREEKIVLMGLADLNQVQKRMLDKVSAQVTSLVFAPESETEGFDAYGSLKSEYWVSELNSPLREEEITAVENPADQAAAVMDFLDSLQGAYPAERIAVGIPDAAVEHSLVQACEKCGVPWKNHLGKPLGSTSLYLFLRTLLAFMVRDDFESLAALVRHPYAEQALLRKGIVSPQFMESLDTFQQKRLPYQLGRGLSRKLAAQNASEVRDIETIREIYRFLREILQGWDAQTVSMTQWKSLLEKILFTFPGEPSPFERWLLGRILAESQKLEAIPESLLGKLSPVVMLEIFLRELEKIRLVEEEELFGEENAEEGIEWVGWLDMIWTPHPVSVIVSCNEGVIPQAANGHLFLPNRLRNWLGVMDNDRRLARDAYLLRAIHDTREKLQVVFSLHGETGEPLLPSRLLFRQGNPHLPAQAKAYFGEKTSRPRYEYAWEGIPRRLAESRREARDWAEKNLTGGGTLRGYVTELSPTKWKDYIACPFRFYLRHILKLEPIDDHAQEMSPLEFGNAVHTILEQWGQREKSRPTPTRSREILERELESLLEEYFTTRFPRSVLPAVNVQQEILRSRLKAFAAFQASWDGGQIWALEKSLEMTLELPGGGKMNVTGRIDRIDFHPGLGYTLMDYKSGDTLLSPDSVYKKKTGEWKDLQLPLYWEMMRRLPERENLPIRLGYLVLPKKTEDTAFLKADWETPQLEDALSQAADIAEKIQNGIFWPPKELPGNIRDDYQPYVEWLKDGQEIFKSNK
ncbi:MAG: PD-(D/E)XK nuclease family protein [Planctomycetia bacterium]|nr:PD-(D/E)XK nuclease family protein [Planctomycetia bacterium]